MNQLLQKVSGWLRAGLGKTDALDPKADSDSCTNTGTDLNSPFAGARVNRLNNHWRPRHYSGDNAIHESWNLLTARIRDRVRNDAVLTKAKKVLVRLVIGNGIMAFSDASELQEENEELVNFEIDSDTWFLRWALEEADSEGEHSLFEMQQIAFGDEIEGGNTLWLEVMDDTPGRTIPLCYQLIEWEQMDFTKDRDGEYSRKFKGRYYNRISNGIEFDRRNRKVAFHIYDAHPFDRTMGWTSASAPVPVDRVLHEYWPHRPSAKLGVTWFAPNLPANSDLDKYIANELTTRALQALMGVSIKTADRDVSLGLDALDPDTGLPTFKLGYPHIGVLRETDEVSIHESARGASEATALINLLLNLQAMGCNISLYRLLGDPAKTNLASIKAAHQDDAESVAPVQNNVARKIVMKIRKKHIAQGFAYGLFRGISARDYRRQPWRFNALECIASNRADLDKDDGEASIDRLRSGLSTYQDECARRGLHWRRQLRRIAVVNKEADRLDVLLDWTKGQGGQTDHTSTQETEATSDAASPNQ